MALPGTWKSFAIQTPGKDFLGKARNILETLLVYLELVKAFLETVKGFLVDFGNPLKLLLDSLIKLIVTLIKTLQQTGIYALFDTPDPFKDPRLTDFEGGFVAFKRRFKGSLVDVEDFNRPQPIKGALTGGFVLIVADAGEPALLMSLIKTLLKFFGQEFFKPIYGPPANVRVVPVGASGDPILAVTKVFKDQVKAVAVEWSLASVAPTADPAYEGLAGSVAQEFHPPSWLIERSEVPLNNEILDTEIDDPAKVGQVVRYTDTGLINPRPAPGQPANQVVKKKQKLLDENGDPFIKFQAYAILSPGNNPASFFAGQLGTFRFLDNGVEIDKTYFYRVRAFSGKLVLTGTGSDPDTPAIGKLTFPKSAIKRNMNDAGTWFFEWPGLPSNPVVVGRPSQVVRVKIPKINPKFDVVEVLRRLFLTAFSFNFQLPLPPPVTKKDAKGKDVVNPLGYVVFLPQFNADGDPLPPLDATDIGKGLLTKLAGVLGSFIAMPVIRLDGTLFATKYEVNPATGKLPDMPWQMKQVRFQAARNTVKFAGVFLDVPATLVEAFRALMQGPLPAGTPTTKGTLTGADTLEKMVFALTKTTFVQGTAGKAASAVLETDVFSTDVFGSLTVDQDTAATYGTAFMDPIVRKNLQAAINFLLATASQGVPPNWIQISILRDLIPWSGQLLYDLLAKIQALADAFKGVIDELKGFIDLLVRKIDTFERFLKFLLDILSYIESLSTGFFLLNVTGLTGNVDQWFEAIETAGGDAPASGYYGYTAGICFAYLAPDVTALEAAFSAIF